MKKVYIIVICVLFAFLLGACVLYNNTFPKAPPISHPLSEDITGVLITQKGNPSPIIEENFYDLIQSISNAKPTRIMCTNDYPTASTYYTVVIATSDREYRYFIYKDNSKSYIEVAYEGIYETSHEFYNLIASQFENASEKHKFTKTIETTENSIMKEGQLPVEISDEDANTLINLFQSDTWKEELIEGDFDYLINLKGGITHYNSAIGLLCKYNLSEATAYSSKVEKASGKSLTLSEENRAYVNSILKKYTIPS